jgi:hypothetical protein
MKQQREKMVPGDRAAAAAGMNAPDFLVESIPNELHPGQAGCAQNPWLALVFPVLLPVGAGAACYWAAGATLGLFLGGLLMAAILTGPLVAAERTWLGRALAWATVVHGIAGVWLYAAIRTELDLGLWAACYLTLNALVLAIGGVAALLRGLRIGPTGSGAIATVLALAWMLWPVWLSPALRGARGERMVAWLVPAHPIFAANAVLRPALGYWAEQGIVYHYTSLSDDVNYPLPDGVLWCVLVHAGIGAMCVGVAATTGRRA